MASVNKSSLARGARGKMIGNLVTKWSAKWTDLEKQWKQQEQEESSYGSYKASMFRGKGHHCFGRHSLKAAELDW